MWLFGATNGQFHRVQFNMVSSLLGVPAWGRPPTLAAHPWRGLALVVLVGGGGGMDQTLSSLGLRLPLSEWGFLAGSLSPLVFPRRPQCGGCLGAVGSWPWAASRTLGRQPSPSMPT